MSWELTRQLLSSLTWPVTWYALCVCMCLCGCICMCTNGMLTNLLLSFNDVNPFSLNRTIMTGSPRSWLTFSLSWVPSHSLLTSLLLPLPPSLDASLTTSPHSHPPTHVSPTTTLVHPSSLRTQLLKENEKEEEEKPSIAHTMGA